MSTANQPFQLSEWIERQFRQHPLVSWAVVGVATVLFLLWLLTPDVSELDPLQQSQKEVEQRERKLLLYAINVLRQCEEYDPKQITLRVVERLNQWLEFQRSPQTWQPPRAITQFVPEELRNRSGFSRLGKLEFEHHEGIILVESMWLRWISDRAVQQGDSEAPQESLAAARRLFDWTVRNIQIEDVGEKEVRELVWQTLLFGRGHPLNRVWTFMLLARQQGMEVVLLAFPGQKEGDPPRPWIPAVYIDGELYLFDHMLGLPVPGPGGQGIATLRQAAEDPQVLRQLDVPGRFTYPVRSEQLQEVIALFEASPHFLSRRMRLLEDQLAGPNHLVLSIHADYIAETLSRCAHVKQVRPWLWPYECRLRQGSLSGPERAAELRKLQPFLEVSGYRVRGKRRFNLEKALAKAGWKFLQQQDASGTDGTGERSPGETSGEVEEVERPLWKARILHFRGELSGEQGAVHHYQLLRVPDHELEQFRKQWLVPMRHQLQLMQNDPTIPPERLQQIQQQAQRVEQLWQAMLQAKEDATYWLGLAAYDRGDYETAVEYLKHRILENEKYRRWINGARYNLGRAYEAAGKYQQAVAAYESDTSLQRHGSVLRARRLRRKLAAASGSSTE